MGITKDALECMQIRVAALAKNKKGVTINYVHVEGTKIPKSICYDTTGRVRLPIKPMSVNEAWRGRKFSTPEKKAHEKRLADMLPDITIPAAPYKVYYKFGFSSAASDFDNCIKIQQDILSKRYGFNDKLIKKAVIEIEQVKKGNEFFEFLIESL